MPFSPATSNIAFGLTTAIATTQSFLSGRIPQTPTVFRPWSRNCFVGSQFEKVCDRASLRGAAHFRNLVNFFDVSTSGFGEEHQVIVRRGGEQMFDEIAFLFLGRAFARRHPDHAFAAAALRAKGADGGPLDEPAVSDADDATLIRDQVLHVDLAFVGNELSQPGRRMLVANFAQLFLDDLV